MRTRFRLAAGSLLVGFLLLFQTGLAFGHGSFHERIDYLTKALEQTPADPILRFELANLHGLHGDTELALEDLRKVDTLAPGKFPTDLIRGTFCLTSATSWIRKQPY